MGDHTGDRKPGRRTHAADEGTQGFRRRSRREILKLAPLAGAGLLLVPSLRRRFLDAGLAWSDSVSEATFSRRLAPTFADSEIAPLEKVPYNFYLVQDPEVDVERWSLSVSGHVRRPGEYRLADLHALPKVTQNTRLICIEGWDVIANWAGARLSDFLDAVGAAPDARFVEFECADDYYESIEMDAARHPQTLLCYEMYGQPLTGGHGAPLRLQMPTKLGYKQAKHLTALRVSRVLSSRRGYWVDMGYSWHGGL
jgi:DMSO/TMAO reductase YedYZ molybdopterin-dependent catalytic subunit